MPKSGANAIGPARYRSPLRAALLGTVLASPALAPAAPSAGSTVGTAELELRYVDELELVWSDDGSGATQEGAVYRPVVPRGFHALGHYMERRRAEVAAGYTFVARAIDPDALAEPTGYIPRWNDDGGGAPMNVTLWEPQCPTGYVHVGHVAHPGHDPPPLDAVRCVREDLTVPASLGNFIYTDAGSGGEYELVSLQIVPADEHGVFIGAFFSVCTNCGLGGFPPPVYAIDSTHVQAAYQGGTSHAPSIIEAHALIQEFGPTIRLHPDDIYAPDDADKTIDESGYLRWGLVYNESDYDTFSMDLLGEIKTSSRNLEDDVAVAMSDPNADDPAFRVWLRFDLDPTDLWGRPLSAGNVSRAKAYVKIQQWNELFTDLQFWFFYPFNGPGKFRAQCGNLDLGGPGGIRITEVGRHYGDWEQVTLRIAGTPRKLTSVYMSRHGFAHWVMSQQFSPMPWDCDFLDLDPDVQEGRHIISFKQCALQMDGTHPVIYAAQDSHAHYPTPQNQKYDRAFSLDIGICNLTVDLIDRTADGGAVFEAFRPGSYKLIASDITVHTTFDLIFDNWHQPGGAGDLNGDGIVNTADVLLLQANMPRTPSWLSFQGRWGQYELLDFMVGLDSGRRFDVISGTSLNEVGAGPRGPAQKKQWDLGPSAANFWWTVNPLGYEHCRDEIDNDLNGLFDCNDPDCSGFDFWCQ